MTSNTKPKLFGILLLALGLLQASYAAPLAPGNAYLLLFREKEPWTDSFSTRMIVTERYLRIDDAVDNNEFILFDREERRIYNVSEEGGTILVITPLPIEVSPPKVFSHHVESVPVNGDEKTWERNTSRRILSTNGKQCYEIDAVAGLLEEPRRALSEFYRILAGEQAVVMAFTPRELQSDCDLANNIFLPTRHLEYGFPVRKKDMAGRERTMTDYTDDYKPDPKLFQLPAGFTRYTTAEMRGAVRGGRAKDSRFTTNK